MLIPLRQHAEYKTIRLQLMLNRLSRLLKLEEWQALEPLLTIADYTSRAAYWPTCESCY